MLVTKQETQATVKIVWILRVFALHSTRYLSFFIPPPSLDHTALLNNIPRLNTDLDNSFMENPITPDEYFLVVKSLKIHSAPGPDLITNFIIS